MENATHDVSTPDEVNLFAPAQLRCPWPSYQVLRDQAPVWKDPATGAVMVTRYEDVRKVLTDPDTFHAYTVGDDTHIPEIKQLYEDEGMLPATTMIGLDDPLHRQIRKLMDYAFRPKRVAQLDPYLDDLCKRLVGEFPDSGEIEISGRYAQELAVRVIAHIMGAPEEDGQKIQAWNDAWIIRLSGTDVPLETKRWSAEQEIEAQHYFQPIIDRVREQPDESLISDIVNGVVPEWGHGLDENQIHIEILVDMFGGGTQTTGHALTSAIKYLIEHPETWRLLQSDPDRYLRNFIEEIVRIDGPQQSMPRIAARDTEIAGVEIPEGTVLNVRWGAANRDERQFGDSSAEIKLDRERPMSHLGFGTGVHHCIGSALARRSMFFGLKALLDHIDRLWFIGDPGDIEYVESYVIRGPKAMTVGFDRRIKDI
jgi:cytochrome P450